ncbi:pimeloyl-ACP methyl ester carboxylesterase [Actinoalloteichus hoggarensis]|uniref:Tropinesterase n=1 Tax=Actinoalloteichus hoggarensis TaxID=1470176 RepID=A0A221W352_9PSEU|nr:alpha/beta hydrolase [Actinoalloteichus hoggarensis]ASO20154.1 Tropinesterase [Actinoalloteichus hoggarensis]MBB5919133.1 pimeloyl-ACP methyl ester carboxylesterase [Actinoalloteichus hoggarensis]
MHVRTTGPLDAPVLLFIHGGGMAGWMWSSQITHFEQRYRILVPDLPGHDKSSDEEFTTSADVVAALAEEVRALPDGTDVTVIGFSLGAQITIALAAAHPDLVDRVVVVSALTQGAPLPGVVDWIVGVTAPLARRPGFAKLQAKSLFVPDELLDDYLRTSAALSKESLVALTRANAVFRTPDSWRDYPGQALLLAGSKEPRALLRAMPRLHADLPGSEWEVHPGTGHGLPLAHPAWFNTRVDEWIARHSR